MNDETMQSCASCRNYHIMAGNHQCRLAPPQPLLVGIQQAKAPGALVQVGKPEAIQVPVVQGFFSPTMPNNWCGQWRPKDFEGERPPLPVRAAEPKVSYRT